MPFLLLLKILFSQEELVQMPPPLRSLLPLPPRLHLVLLALVQTSLMVLPTLLYHCFLPCLLGESGTDYCTHWL